jgi:hypothetical protein
MKTTTHLPGRTGRFGAFTLAIIFALLLPACLLAAQPRVPSHQAAEDLQPFAGTYHLLGNQHLALEISPAGDKLTLKERWSNREITFRQMAALNFVATDHPDFTLEFARDKNGAIRQVTAFKKDIWVRADPKGAEKKLSAAEGARLNEAYQKIFPAFQEAVNGNDSDKIQSFLSTYMDETLVAALTMERLVDQAKGMYQKTGGIVLDPGRAINPETGTATFKSKNGENPFQMSFTLNPAGKITNFGMQE